MLLYSANHQLKYSIPRPPACCFLCQSGFSRNTLALWSWESLPALSTLLYLISRLRSYLRLVQLFIKFPNHPVPLHSDLHPCFLAGQHQVDTQSILLLSADDFWLSPFVPFSCWEYHFRIQLIQGKFMQPLTLSCS